MAGAGLTHVTRDGRFKCRRQPLRWREEMSGNIRRKRPDQSAEPMTGGSGEDKTQWNDQSVQNFQNPVYLVQMSLLFLKPTAFRITKSCQLTDLNQ